MLKLSRITDYGIVLLAHLAKGAHTCAEPQNARDLAIGSGSGQAVGDGGGRGGHVSAHYG